MTNVDGLKGKVAEVGTFMELMGELLTKPFVNMVGKISEAQLYSANFQGNTSALNEILNRKF